MLLEFEISMGDMACKLSITVLYDNLSKPRYLYLYYSTFLEPSSDTGGVRIQIRKKRGAWRGAWPGHCIRSRELAL